MKFFRKFLIRTLIDKKKIKLEKRKKTTSASITRFLGSMLDENWYRDAVDVKFSANESAFEHYLKVGLPLGIAPCATLAATDGKYMVSWLKIELDQIHAPPETVALNQHVKHQSTDVFLKPETFENPSGKRLAVYTANFGGYDVVGPVRQSWKKTTDFYCFTDGLSKNLEGWSLISPNYFNVDPRRTARFYKLHPHLFFSQYEWSLWIDGNIRLVDCPMKIVERYLDGAAQIVTIKHPLRGCVYQEAVECALREKDDASIMFEQVERYLASGYPRMNGLIESNVILRRHSDLRLIGLMRRWWGEIERGSCRDQLSFNYCLSKNPEVLMDFFPEASARNSPRFQLEKHLSG